MNIAYSPCPNDTFIFHALAHGHVPDAPPIHVTFADIDITNRLAMSEDDQYDVLKISYAALPYVTDRYRLLACGGALGRGCGPLVLTHQAVDASQLAGKKIAVPSEHSTAYLLFRLWVEQAVPGGIGEIIVMPFHQIMVALQQGKIDAGLVIHEARFTYLNYGLHMVADLGAWWERETALPLPLGAIIAKRELDATLWTTWIRQSVQQAWDNPAQSQHYIRCHAQEMSPAVTQQHIDLYVNEFSYALGEEGKAAIAALFSRAAASGLIPPVELEQLF